MDKEKMSQRMTQILADFVGYFSKVLPDDVDAKLKRIGSGRKESVGKNDL